MELAGEEVVIPGAQASCLVRQIESLLASAQLLLHPFCLGQVTYSPEKAEDLAPAVEHAGQRDLGGKPGSIPAHHPALRAGPSRVGCIHHGPFHDSFLLVLRQEQIVHGKADELILRVAEDALDVRIPGQAVSAIVQFESRVADRLLLGRAVVLAPPGSIIFRPTAAVVVA